MRERVYTHRKIRACGSNGQTYSNECEFENAKCKDENLTMKYFFTCLENKNDVIKRPYVVQGKFKLLPKAPVALPSGSCMRAVFRENIACDEPVIEEGGEGVACDIPVLAKIEVNDPKFNQDGSIDYAIAIMQSLVTSSINIDATLNMGWCKKSDSDWLRDGDFTVVTASIVDIDPKKTRYNHDVELEEYKKPGMCSSFIYLSAKPAFQPVAFVELNNTGDVCTKLGFE